jgi:hypothetical protein
LAPIHDLTLKDGDLIVATHGRSFWILDDVSPLRQIDDAGVAKPAFLFAPSTALRVSGGGGFGGGRRGPGQQAQSEPLGQNPPSGILVHYSLRTAADEVKLEIIDAEGKAIGSLTSPPKAPGLHRVSLQIPRHPSFSSFPGMILWAAGPSPILAPPGKYTLRLSASGQGWTETQQRELTLKKDPRLSASEADLVEQFQFARRIAARTTEANDAVVKIRDVKRGIEEALQAAPGDVALASSGAGLRAKMEAIESEIYQVKNRSGQDPLNYPIKLNNKLAALLGVVLGSDFRPTDQSFQVFAELSKQLQAQLDRLKESIDKDLADFNKALAAKGLKPVSVEAHGGRPGSG